MQKLGEVTQSAGSIDEAVGWLARACGGRHTTPGRLRAVLVRRRHLRWRAELFAALTDVRAGCHSVLERRYLTRVERAHGLPAAGRQTSTQPVGRRRRYDDVRYRRWRLVVELDGRVAHPEETRGRDRRRDNDTVVSGDAVLRFGWGDVTERPCLVARDVATVLRRGGWGGRLRSCSPGCAVATAGSPVSR